MFSALSLFCKLLRVFSRKLILNTVALNFELVQENLCVYVCVCVCTWSVMVECGVIRVSILEAKKISQYLMHANPVVNYSFIAVLSCVLRCKSIYKPCVQSFGEIAYTRTGIKEVSQEYDD